MYTSTIILVDQRKSPTFCRQYSIKYTETGYLTQAQFNTLKAEGEAEKLILYKYDEKRTDNPKTKGEKIKEVNEALAKILTYNVPDAKDLSKANITKLTYNLTNKSSWNAGFNNTFSKDTQTAVKTWQTKKGLSPTGYLTQIDYDQLIKDKNDLVTILDDTSTFSPFKNRYSMRIRDLNNVLATIYNQQTDLSINNTDPKDNNPVGSYYGENSKFFTSKVTSKTIQLINKFQNDNKGHPYYLTDTRDELDTKTFLAIIDKGKEKKLLKDKPEVQVT